MRALAVSAGLFLLAACGTASPAPGVTAGVSPRMPRITAAPGITYVHDPGHVTGTIPARCTARGQLPDPQCTPGGADPAVTQADIKATICRSGWTATVRPPESETGPVKTKMYAAYRIPAGTPAELDHLIPLELGGDNDTANLWPEAGTVPNPKDRTEAALRRAVCAGRVSLAAARAAIAADWVTAESRLGIPEGA